MHPDGTPLRATAILRGGGGCVGREGERGTGREWDYAHSGSAYTSRRARSSCAAVLDFGHPVGGEIQEQAGLEGGLEANKP